MDLPDECKYVTIPCLEPEILNEKVDDLLGLLIILHAKTFNIFKFWTSCDHLTTINLIEPSAGYKLGIFIGLVSY